MMGKWTVGLLVAAVIVLLAPHGASAQSPAYVGRWAAKPGQCRNDQAQQNAPLILRRNGYDQHEAHCTFRSVRKSGESWRVRARCSVEGDQQTHELTLAVKGNRLTIRDTRGSRVLHRCN